MLEVRLLGQFEIKLNGQTIELHARPAQSLLAYLMLNVDKTHRRENLAGLLWPDFEETKARNNLRQMLWQLRKAIGETYFLADKISIAFNPEIDYQLDVDVLQQDTDLPLTTERLVECVSVYKGKLLPGFYDDWVLLEQERLQMVFETQIQRLIDQLISEAQWQAVREWAEQWLAQGQTPEPAYRALMQAYAGLGDQAGVATIFQRCVKALDEELGVAPSSETEQLFEALTSGESLPQLYQNGTRSQVEAPSHIGTITHLSPTPSPTNLPHQPTPFLGRSDELAQLMTSLTDASLNLVTILGPGGMGKTRLAIEAAKASAKTFADGVYFVPLASLDDPTLIVSQIAETLDFSFYVRDQREHWRQDSQMDQLLAYLQDKELLLVLDNIEHLLTSALPQPGTSRTSVDEIIGNIIRTAPQVKVLGTSRERLNLQGETLFPLGGLTFPNLSNLTTIEDIPAYSAVQLFLRSAHRVQPNFKLTTSTLSDVKTICQLVEGMPLAIELAAAWVELLTPAEIVTEIQSSLDFLETSLRDIPDRQHSLRSVFNSMWSRLSETEQDLFQQLSIFRGSFTREAVQNVAKLGSGSSPQKSSPLILRTLMALANKSLLRPDLDGGYYIHELLRQFGTERLAAVPDAESALRDRHCTYYAHFLNQKEPDLVGPKQGEAIAAIEAEIDNIRVAWSWAVEQGKLREIDLAMEGLCEFHRIRGRLIEATEIFIPAARTLGWAGFPSEDVSPTGQELFDETIEILHMDFPSPAQDRDRLEVMGKLLAREARFYCESPHHVWRASQIRQNTLKILGQVGALEEMAYVVRYLGHAGQTPAEAQALYEQALTIFKESGDQRGVAETCYRLGTVATQIGDYQEAQELFQQSLKRTEVQGRREMVMSCFAELGYLDWSRGHYQSAQTYCEKSIAIATEIGYESQIAWVLRNMARIALSQADYATAKQQLLDCLVIYKQIGLNGMRADTLGELAHVALFEQDFDKAQDLAQESLQLCQYLEHRAGMIEAYMVLGGVALQRDDFQTAQTNFNEAIQAAQAVWLPVYTLHTLLGVVRLKMKVGDIKQALGLAYLILNHPASWHWSKDLAISLITELEASLSSEVVAAAQTWSQQQSLEIISAEFINCPNTEAG